MKFKVEIDLEFGSNFQADAHLPMVKCFVEVLTIQMSQAHKKNKIDYAITQELK